MSQYNSINQVREEIDKIDDQLVDLISKRSHLVKEAASFKNSIEEIKAVDRIEHIVQRARQRAIKREISPNMMSDLFTIMINEMVETEISEFRNKGSF